jgi:flagellar basal body-associated protein FliL
VTQPDRPSGGRTLITILLVMVAVLAALVALAIWASDGA